MLKWATSSINGSAGRGCCNIEAAAWLEDGEAKRLVSLAVNPSLFFVWNESRVAKETRKFFASSIPQKTKF